MTINRTKNMRTILESMTIIEDDIMDKIDAQMANIIKKDSKQPPHMRIGDTRLWQIKQELLRDHGKPHELPSSMGDDENGHEITCPTCQGDGIVDADGEDDSGDYATGEMGYTGDNDAVTCPECQGDGVIDNSDYIEEAVGSNGIVDRDDLWQGDFYGEPNEPGWFTAWDPDTDIVEVLEQLAVRLSFVGVTIEMINDDDWAKIRLVHNGKALGE